MAIHNFHKGDVVYVHYNMVDSHIYYDIIKDRKLVNSGYLDKEEISTFDYYNFFREMFNSGTNIVFGEVPEKLRAEIIRDLTAKI